MKKLQNLALLMFYLNNISLHIIVFSRVLMKKKYYKGLQPTGY